MASTGGQHPGSPIRDYQVPAGPGARRFSSGTVSRVSFQGESQPGVRPDLEAELLVEP